MGDEKEVSGDGVEGEKEVSVDGGGDEKEDGDKEEGAVVRDGEKEESGEENGDALNHDKQFCRPGFFCQRSLSINMFQNKILPIIFSTEAAIFYYLVYKPTATGRLRQSHLV